MVVMSGVPCTHLVQQFPTCSQMHVYAFNGARLDRAPFDTPGFCKSTSKKCRQSREGLPALAGLARAYLGIWFPGLDSVPVVVLRGCASWLPCGCMKFTMVRWPGWTVTSRV